MLTIRTILWGTLLSLIALASCSKDEGPGGQDICAVCNVTEKTSIQISGGLELVDFTQSLQSDASNDLVYYNFYGDPANDFDFVIQLQSGWKLLIELYDEDSGNPWEQVEQSFNAYPGKDLNEISRYARISLEKGGETPGYTTNPTSGVSPSTLFSIFKITSESETEIQGRIRDLILYKTGNPSTTITINGTFVGAATYR